MVKQFYLDEGVTSHRLSPTVLWPSPASADEPPDVGMFAETIKHSRDIFLPQRYRADFVKPVARLVRRCLGSPLQSPCASVRQGDDVSGLRPGMLVSHAEDALPMDFAPLVAGIPEFIAGVLYPVGSGMEYQNVAIQADPTDQPIRLTACPAPASGTVSTVRSVTFVNSTQLAQLF